MAKYEVNLTNDQERILYTIMTNINEWIQNAINVRLSIALDSCIIEYTDLRPDKLTDTQKYDALKDKQLETAEEKKSKLTNVRGG